VLLPDVRSCEEQEMNKASTNEASIRRDLAIGSVDACLWSRWPLDGGSPQQHLVDPSSSRTPKLSLPPKNLSRVEV
jgi:hypothetical protein